MPDMTGLPDEQKALDALVRRAGDDFVRYLLSVPDATPWPDVELTDARKHAIELVFGQTSSGDALSESIALDAYMQVSSLSSRAQGADTSIVNLIRQFTGGEIETVEPTGDALEDSLLAMARDVWPIYLARPQIEGPRTFWMATPAGVYNHPALGDAIDAFLNDSQLMKLFPFPPEPAEGPPGDHPWSKAMQASLVITNGQGGSLQLLSLISGLIAHAAFRCLITGSPLRLETLRPHILRSVEDLRSLAEGETVHVPALVGFSGVSLPDDASLELPEGRLRPANGTDRELFMAGAKSLVTVFETTFPIRVYSIAEHKFVDGENPFKEYSKFDSRITEVNRSFARQLDFVRLSLLLASAPDTPWLAREVARYIPDLLNHGGSSSWDPGMTGVPTFELPTQAFDSVQDWCALVRQKHVPSLDIGMRRLLSATTLRTDPIDAFVDAVICWESLFGVQTETTFRVTGAIAKLLEPTNLNKREELHKELKDLYGRRSKLVHGGSEPAPGVTDKYRRRATEVAGECFRQLYRERADLLELPSDARGARLLLE